MEACGSPASWMKPRKVVASLFASVSIIVATPSVGCQLSCTHSVVVERLTPKSTELACKLSVLPMANVPGRRKNLFVGRLSDEWQ